MFTLLLKYVRPLLIVCVIATIGQASVVFSQSTSWQRYKAEGFSVLLPEHPTTLPIIRRSDDFQTRRTGRLFGAYEDRVAYVILAFENPNHRDPLRKFIDEIQTFNISAKAEKLGRELHGAGFTGKEFSFVNGPTLSGVVRFYLTKDRVYVVEAVGDDVTRPAIKQFLDSFSIGSDDNATNILENPPAAEPVRSEPDPALQPKIFVGKDVTSKARVLVKPEPIYTETARQAQVTGTVVLRAVFTATGHVTQLKAISGLPFGLTESAILAAKNLKFIPAMKDGHFVSMYIQLEYNFNLY